jgi:hypothetical protein
MMTTLLLRIVWMIISTWLIVMMILMIQLIPIMMIISNTCNTMLLSNYVLFILHLFISTSCLSVFIGLLFLIACD